MCRRRRSCSIAACRFVIVPCYGVTSHLLTTLAELREFIGGTSRIGDYLCQIFKEYRPDSFRRFQRHLGYFDDRLADQARLGAERSGAQSAADGSGHLERRSLAASGAGRQFFVHRDPIFRDLFGKIRDFGGV